MRYRLPIDTSCFDYRNNELFYNSLMQKCENSCFRDYQLLFKNMEYASQIGEFCKQQLLSFTRERIPILMTMPHPDRHVMMTAKRIAFRQSSRLRFKSDREFLNQIRSHEITDFSEQILDDILYEQELSHDDRISVLNRLSPRDCYLYFLRYLLCLEPAQIESLTIWKQETICNQLEHISKRMAKAIMSLFQTDKQYLNDKRN